MACQLRTEGRSIASLTLIDSRLPEPSEHIKDVEDSQIMMEFLKALELNFDKKFSIARSTLEAGLFEPFARELHSALMLKGCVLPRSASDMLLGPLVTFAAARRGQYWPGARYTGPAQLILAPDPLLDTAQNEAAFGAIADEWRERMDRLIVWRGPGDHFSILRPPHVQALADRWRQWAAPGDRLRQAEPVEQTRPARPER
jgi:thioesterase domain-containing protein